MSELIIIGYSNSKKLIKNCRFDLTGLKKDEYLIVFASYSKYEIPAGTTLSWFHCVDNRNICIDVKIKSINCNIGPPINSIPKGFKTILLLTGLPNYIAELKAELKAVKGWGDKKAICIKAFDINKNTNFLGVDFPYVPGDPFW